MGNFEQASAVKPRGTVDGRVGDYDVELDPDWMVAGALHGGYLLAVIGRAASDLVGPDYPHVESASTTFVSAPEAGPAVVTVEILRAGRAATRVRARLLQHDATVVEAVTTHGVLTREETWWSRLPPVELPPEADCVRVPVEPPGVGFRVDMLAHIEERLDPAVLGFTAGRPTGAGRVAGYLRLADGTQWDAISLLITLDIGPPASFDLGIAGRAPTMQLTAYVRGLPVPGPVRFELRAGEVRDDLMDETMRVWDSAGQQVGQAHQLALVRTPDGPPPGA